MNAYGDFEKRLLLARAFVTGAAHGLLRNLSYYERRKGDGGDDDEHEGPTLPDKETDEAIAIEGAVAASIDLLA